MTFSKTKNLLSLFEESEYAKAMKSAIEFYKNKRENLESEIDSTKKLKEIILKQSPDSFAGWAVGEEIKLNELQESVLFHFATTPTKFNKNDNYIPEPEKFIEALKNEVRKTDTGFVVNLSGLHYHIAKRENYIFTNPKKLKAEIEKFGKDFQAALTSLQKDIDKIDKLEKLFSEFHFSQEHLTAYLNREDLKSFISDSTLNLTPQQFSEIIEIYENDIVLKGHERVNALYLIKQNLYEQKLGRRTTSEQK